MICDILNTTYGLIALFLKLDLDLLVAVKHLWVIHEKIQ